jgi:F420-dependent oxidoreductase-like protein
MSIKFGLNATNQYTNWTEYRSLAETAEAAGLDSFWVFDHFVPGPFDPTGAALECFTTISALAAVTRRLTLGTLVLGVTYRNPALVAKMGAMVDHISDGRFVLGLGAGWYGLEHRMYGIDFPPPGERVSRVAEALEIIRRMWAEQPATFKGRYYSIEGALVDPAPVQQPHPPILIGARGERMLRLTVKHAQQYNSAADATTIQATNERLDQLCEEAGRDPGTLERTAIVLHSFAATPAEEEAKQRRLEEIFRKPFSELENRVLTGSPDHVCEQLQAYVDAGVTHFMLSTMAPYDLDGVRIWAEEIAPRFR